MNIKMTRIKTALTILIVVILFLWTMYTKTSTTTTKDILQDIQSSLSTQQQQERVLFRKPFLYLVQVSSCLSTYYSGKDVLGDANLNHDVLVLSYKQLCTTSNQTHIQYIQAPFKTSFATGRNYLYNYSSNELNEKYLYYIFLDEDVSLANSGEILADFGKTLNKEGQKIMQKAISPWRKFEQFLVSYQPPIGNVERYDYLWAIKRKRKPRILPTYLFPGLAHDAMVNAFRYDIVHDIYPLNLKYDTWSWWATVQVYMCSIFIRFHGQLVTFTPVYALNEQHSSYPQGLLSLKDMCREEMNIAPSHIKSSEYLKLLFQTYEKHRDVVEFSYVVPPKFQKNRKYKYFPSVDGALIFS